MNWRRTRGLSAQHSNESKVMQYGGGRSETDQIGYDSSRNGSDTGEKAAPTQEAWRWGKKKAEDAEKRKF